MIGKYLVVGRGYVGTAFAKHECIDAVSHVDVFNVDLREYIAIINCAGIIGSKKCEKSTNARVEDANIRLPLNLLSLANSQEHGMKFIQFSTVGMYMPQTCPDIENFEMPTEKSATMPYNQYIQSKLKMESILSDCYIFRMPWFVDKGVFLDRIKNYRYVQDTYTSIITKDTLINAIFSTIKGNIPFGLYNIADSIVYFPDYLSKMVDKELPVNQTYSDTMTSAVPVCTNKAKEAGIL